MSDEDRIRRLLLGALSEGERETLEARLVSEEELFALASEIEDEVAGAYAAGTLTADERRAFEAQLVLVPRLRERVGAARALDRAAARLRPAPPSFRQRVVAWLRPAPGGWQWSLAGGLAGALVVGVLLRSQLAVMQDEQASLRRERDQATAAIARLEDEAREHARRTAPTFALAPGVSRSAFGSARLRLSARTGAAVFHLDLERALAGPLRVVLENGAGQQLLVRDGLRGQDQAGYVYVEVEVPLELLASGSHAFQIFTLADGRAASAGRYVFELDRQP